MSSRGAIPQHLIDEVLATVAATRPTSSPPDPVHGGLHDAAAVLAWFTPDSLCPVDGGASDSVDLLLQHSEPTADAAGIRRWTLHRNVRVAVLRRLREQGSIDVALAANPDRPPDPLQVVFEQYLTGSPPPLAEQSLETFACTVVVCDWLRAAGFPGVPAATVLNARLEWLKLLQPFEHLVGTTFSGREDELRSLHDFLERPGGGFRPVLIHGPGGVGKSTLLAKFILLRAQVDEQDRHPVVYLDFDRPDVDAAEPLTLFMEAIRQLGVEHPDARERCEAIRQQWQRQLAQGRRDPERIRNGAVHDFGTVVRTHAAGRPLLFVLDTFEEVQWRSQEQVGEIWRYLEELHERVPRLRVCISGRAEVYDHPVLPIELTGLDPGAAQAFLVAHGVGDPDVAARLVEQVGGSPLSLKLAAQVYAQEGHELGGRPWQLHLNVSDTLLQRQLYQRILRHIHDPQVRGLAHPGLVLRRITPELIERVLAEPCDLGSADPVVLFEELRREVSLVRVAADGSLHHRQDVRRLMVDLLRSEQPKKVRAIDQRAVEYYAGRPDNPVDRAEEIYHRLALDEDLYLIDARWLPGVEPLLASTMSEFTGARRAFLASRLGLEVDPETRRLASLEDWERLVAGKAERLLRDPDVTRPTAVLDLFADREDRSPVSPLTALEVTAHRYLEQWDRGLALLARAVDHAASVEAWPHVLRLTLLQAEIMLVSRHDDDLPDVLEQLEMFAVGAARSTGELHAATRHAALRQLMPVVPGGAGDARIDQLIRDLSDALPDREFEHDPDLARWVCLVTDPSVTSRLARLIPFAGLADNDLRGLRAMAAALARLDLELSAARKESPGWLARQYGVTVHSSSLTTAWTGHVLNAGRRWLTQLLTELFRADLDRPLTGVISALNGMLRTALQIEPAHPAAADPSTAPRPVVRLSGANRMRLARALVEAVPNSTEFREFLLFRLDRSLDSFTAADAPFTIAFELVLAANAEGWLSDLVIAAARAFPHIPAFTELAEAAGLVTPMETAIRGMAFDTALWRANLAERLSRICTVTVGGSLATAGLLVGVDLILTTADMIRLQWVAETRVTFDETFGSSGEVLGPGTQFVLAADWLVASTEHVALLRLRGAPGAQPIGGERSGTTGAARGWINLTRSATADVGEHVLVLQPNRISFGEITHMQPDGSGTHTASATLPGAPCFDADLDLIGMLIAPNRYLSAAVITRQLAALGIAELITTELA
ncbi:effector-associated domain EAD1-containing protein [Dactylosporangium cerinum]|uniref:Effector-associated domain EAD1-containing protein n=1 Tax=Dactylosporangium cerinum TaxID=1434730 RepID=A0ABV9WAS8_9ACTN